MKILKRNGDSADLREACTSSTGDRGSLSNYNLEFPVNEEILCQLDRIGRFIIVDEFGNQSIVSDAVIRLLYIKQKNGRREQREANLGNFTQLMPAAVGFGKK